MFVNWDCVLFQSKQILDSFMFSYSQRCLILCMTIFFLKGKCLVGTGHLPDLLHLHIKAHSATPWPPRLQASNLLQNQPTSADLHPHLMIYRKIISRVRNTHARSISVLQSLDTEASGGFGLWMGASRNGSASSFLV